MKLERVWPVPGGSLRVEIETDEARQVMAQIEDCLKSVVRGKWRTAAEAKRGTKREKDCGCSGS